MYTQHCLLPAVRETHRLRRAGLDELILTVIAEEAIFLLGLNRDEGPNKVVEDGRDQNDQEEYLSL